MQNKIDTFMLDGFTVDVYLSPSLRLTVSRDGTLVGTAYPYNASRQTTRNKAKEIISDYDEGTNE